MFTRAEIEETAAFVHGVIPPTPQYLWPLLSEACGCEVWVKHENHTPIGAFKIRGGLTYMDGLARATPGLDGIISATRGNHGQSIAFAARRLGLAAVIVVPEGNSVEKNAAMRALGAELIEHGHDFQAALEFAVGLASARGLHIIPAFHPWLVRGVASCGFEFLNAVTDLDRVYVPIGQGSGICAMIAVRDALGLTTEIVGVVAANAPAYARSFEAGTPISTNSAATFADGLACRVPVAEAVAIIAGGAERVVTVTEDDIAAAMRLYFSATHNLAEGAGAASLAALLAEPERNRGKRVGVILSGGNIDAAAYAEILDGKTPAP
ncbi:MAG: threonine dehydratase [Alphaproteobacteria bacterium]